MTDETRLYRLDWTESRRPLLGPPGGPEQEHDLWARHHDPVALRQYALDQNWDDRRELVVSIRDAHGAVLRAVACRPPHIHAWDSTAGSLPEADPTITQRALEVPAPQRLLRASRIALEAAVRDGVVPRDQAEGMMLLIQDVVRRAETGGQPASGGANATRPS